MRPGPYAALRAAAQLYTPLIVLMAFALLATRGAGTGIGLAAALVFCLALVLGLLVVGAGAARAAAPPPVMRLLAGIGVLLTAVGVSAPRLLFAAQLAEAGLFLATVGVLALFAIALAGRAPTLRDEEGG